MLAPDFYSPQGYLIGEMTSLGKKYELWVIHLINGPGFTLLDIQIQTSDSIFELKGWYKYLIFVMIFGNYIILIIIVPGILYLYIYICQN